jgi:hypothetical protein
LNLRLTSQRDASGSAVWHNTLEFVREIAVVECEGGKCQVGLWVLGAKQLEHVISGEYIIYRIIVQNKDSLDAVNLF